MLKMEFNRFNGLFKVSLGTLNLEFSGGLFSEIKPTRGQYEDPNRDPYGVVNQFFSKLSLDDSKEIFRLFLEARKIFDEGNYATSESLSELKEKTATVIGMFSKKITIEQVANWVRFNAMIPIPTDLRETFEEVENNGQITRDGTYLKDDYIELVAWSICLRIIAPIWSEFYKKNISNNDKSWTLFNTFSTINMSDYSDAYDCKPCERLLRYIKSNINAQVNMDSIVLLGLSSDEFPHYLLARIAIVRVCMFDIEVITDQVSLIKVIFRFIGQCTSSLDREHGITRIRTDNSGNNGESSTSALENLNSRQTLNDGDLVSFEYYLKDWRNFAFQIEPNFDINILEESFSNMEEWSNVEFTDVPIILTKWIIHPVVPSKAVNYLEPMTVLRCMAVARAWYYQFGFPDFAVLCSADTYTDRYDMMGGSNKARITNEYYQKLREVYPYYRRPIRQTNTDKPKLSIETSIEYMSDLINQYSWRSTLPEKWNQTLGLSSKAYHTPENLKILLVELAMQLSQKTIQTSPL